MTCVCVIPARGGSKGIPRKNLQLVGGRPLISRAIDTVLKSGIADAVYVSTDDPEIAEVSTYSGADIIMRPITLAEDHSTSEGALLHALDELRLSHGELLFVQATTPLLEPHDLIKLRSSLQGSDSSLTVTEFHGFLWRANGDGSLSGFNHDPLVRHRRQDLQSHEFLENGAAYLFGIKGFLNSRHRFFGRVGYTSMPRIRSVEIDTVEDLELVNHIYSTLYSTETNSG